jgi:hypothetical protein
LIMMEGYQKAGYGMVHIIKEEEGYGSGRP